MTRRRRRPGSTGRPDVTPHRRCVPSHSVRDLTQHVDDRCCAQVAGSRAQFLRHVRCSTLRLNRQRPPTPRMGVGDQKEESMKKSITIALAALAVVGVSMRSTEARAHTEKEAGSLASTGVDPDARGKVKLTVRNLTDGRLEIEGRLDPNATFDVLVDGVLVGQFATTGGGPAASGSAADRARRTTSCSDSITRRAGGRAQRRRPGPARGATRRQWVGGRRRRHLLHPRQMARSARTGPRRSAPCRAAR